MGPKRGGRGGGRGGGGGYVERDFADFGRAREAAAAAQNHTATNTQASSGGGAEKGAASAGGGGAGRGIPDFKENPRARQGGPPPAGSNAAAAAAAPAAVANPSLAGVVAAAEPSAKFDATEAAAWLSSRYRTVMEEAERQKASGNKSMDFQAKAAATPQS
eukprot:TRINITY_DN82788_c0_g1_i2.p1 TRINITY_DN82788_c0_g1~~TRINITY_DN82788_c0_g1_i2.p1  ORF type:complete len:161 (-),score=41.49 TRINITY_DN82788_c0_g1_i2:146-628(-)